MDQKSKITKHVLNLLNLDSGDISVRKTIPIWWCSTRKKEKGGLNLTTQGFEALSEAGFKSYKIKFDQPVHYTNKLVLYIDKFIDCPFYIKNQDIYVFSEKMAVQLVLFSGNIYKYTYAKASREHS